MNSVATAFFKRCTAGLLLGTLLAGCATLADPPIGYPLARGAAYPFDAKYERFFAGRPENEQALILVAAFGDEVLAGFKQTRDGGVWGKEWMIHLDERRYNDVYLLPVPVGTEFYPKQANVAANDARKSGKGPMILRLNDAQPVRIDKPGIYYFGAIISHDGKAIVNYKVDQRVVDLAMKKYPKVFDGKMPRINF